MPRWRDFQDGTVSMAHLEETRWLGSGPAQDPESERIDREIGERRLSVSPADRSDFDVRLP